MADGKGKSRAALEPYRQNFLHRKFSRYIPSKVLCSCKIEPFVNPVEIRAFIEERPGNRAVRTDAEINQRTAAAAILGG